LSVPTDIVFLVVLWQLRYPLSLRHLVADTCDHDFSSRPNRYHPLD
jgi:hypothetical protein